VAYTSICAALQSVRRKHGVSAIESKLFAAFMVLEWGFMVGDLIAGRRHPVPPEVLKRELLDTVYRYLFK